MSSIGKSAMQVSYAQTCSIMMKHCTYTIQLLLHCQGSSKHQALTSDSVDNINGAFCVHSVCFTCTFCCL